MHHQRLLLEFNGVKLKPKYWNLHRSFETMDAVVSKVKSIYRREWQNDRAREANLVSFQWKSGTLFSISTFIPKVGEPCECRVC